MKSNVPLTYVDAELIEAICGDWYFPRLYSLQQLADNVDFENRDIPTFDQVSYGLARLVARGYIKAMYSPERGLRLKATKEGAALRRAAGRLRRQTSRWRWARIGEYPRAIAELVGAPLPKEYGEVGDMSVGRLPKLNETDWESALSANRLESDRRSPAIERVASLVMRFLRRRHPKDFPAIDIDPRVRPHLTVENVIVIALKDIDHLTDAALTEGWLSASTRIVRITCGQAREMMSAEPMVAIDRDDSSVAWVVTFEVNTFAKLPPGPPHLWRSGYRIIDDITGEIIGPKVP